MDGESSAHTTAIHPACIHGLAGSLLLRILFFVTTILFIMSATFINMITCGSTGGEHIIIANNDSSGNFTTEIIEEIPYDCGLVRYQLPCSMLALTTVSGLP
ncbi:hypothetical protein MRX96_027428 [Rhipicephalus microplus]